MTTTFFNTKISEVKNKVHHNSKFITTEEFTKITADSLAARLKQADLVNKTNFYNTLTSANRRINSNKAKN